VKADKDFEYYNCLRDLVMHSLLHVLMEASMSSRRVSRAARNKLLIRFFKPKLKQPKWKPVKNEIKRLLEIARHPTGHVEARLYELNQKAQESSLGAHQFYDLLVHLNEKEDFGSLLYQEGDEVESDILYIIEEQLTDCFDSLKQIKPISIQVSSERIPSLLSSINDYPKFSVEMKTWHKEQNVAHFLLHSSECEGQHLS